MTETVIDGQGPDHDVIVIGAGFSGIGAGIGLKKMGVENFLILEKSDGVGGAWHDNTYPGVAVDIPSFTYSFSYEPNPMWSQVYARGLELSDYAEHCTDKYDLRRHVWLNTAVLRSEFDEQGHFWRIHTDALGVLTCRYILTATGGLTQPKIPDFNGLADFAGRKFHSARWQHDYDLSGKRVAVIGTGASSVQIVPAIADMVDTLYVFQRTPIWVLPRPNMRIPRLVQRSFRYFPLLQSAVRAVTSTLTEILMVFGLLYNKQAPWLNKGVEWVCRKQLEQQVANEQLRTKLTPAYDFWCKRPTFSNTYLPAFDRTNVELVDDGIETFTPSGIRSTTGKEFEVDCVVLATGFKVFELGNTPAFELVGRGGAELGRFWDENRYQAYEGVSVPNYPNMFSILGPYSLTGASYFSMIEAATTHALRVIREANRRGATCVEVKQSAHDAYFAHVQRRQRNTVFAVGNCAGSNTYYLDKHGDAPVFRPSTGIEMWWHARTFDLDHYEYTVKSDIPAAARRAR